MSLLKQISEMNEATYMVKPGTITPKAEVPAQKSPSDVDYDWKNPMHNPSGKKPQKFDAAKYDPKNYPILDREFGTHLFDPDFVAHMKEVYGKDEWDKMSELEQIKMQLSFVQPMPSTGYDFNKEEDRLHKMAVAMQSKIKRV